MHNKNLFVVVPVFNDSATIVGVIEELKQEGFNNIIVVDDGSRDGVGELLKDLNIYFVRHAVNLGQGAALQTGFECAKKFNADVVVTFDADGQHDAKNIEPMIEQMFTHNVDVVLGSRFLNKPHTSMRVQRKFVLKMARYVNLVFSGMLLTDAHNGLRVLDRKAVELIYITENRMAHASEILFEIRRHKLAFKEAEVDVRYTPYSESKGQSGWNSIRILLDIIIYKTISR
jgi:polyprenyl-phospho-N-acetylgalactosaminyl synthase